MTAATPPPMPGYGPPLPPPPAPKKRRTGLIIGAAVAVAAIVTTTLVIVNSGDDADTSGSAAAETPADSTVTAAAEEEPAPEDTAPEVMALTDGVKYETGVEVTLSGYKRGTSSAWAAPESTPYVAFTVKVVNGSESALDLGTGFVMCYYGDESREGEQIFDEGLDGLPQMKLRPGRTAKATVGCELPKGQSYLQVELAPDMESEVAVFAGNVK